MIYRSPFPDVDIPLKSLPDYVFEGAAAHADRPALIDGPSGRTLTYGELITGIERTAAGLAARGFAKGDVLAIYSPNLPEYAVMFYAVTSVGGVVTTVNPLYTADELAKQLRDAGAKTLITVPPLVEAARAAVDRVGIGEVFVFGNAPGAVSCSTLLQDTTGAPPVTIDPRDDLAVLPFSSGTTGLSKGVMLTHHNLVANMCQTEALERLDVDEVVIGILPFYHIYGMVVVMSLALHQGTTVVTLPRFELEQFLDTMQRHRVTTAYLVPPIVLALAKHPLVDRYDLSSLRHITSGAAPLPESVARACANRLGCEVRQGYGLTETSPVTHFGLRNHVGPPASVGHAIPNTECRPAVLTSGSRASWSSTTSHRARWRRPHRPHDDDVDAIEMDAEWLAEGWLIPCGAMGAVIIGSWLVEAKQSVIENMAPVLTRLFTPLFTIVLLAFLATMAWTGSPIDVEREVLIGFDLLLVLVVGLVLYAASARDPVGLFADRARAHRRRKTHTLH